MSIFDWLFGSPKRDESFDYTKVQRALDDARAYMRERHTIALRLAINAFRSIRHDVIARSSSAARQHAQTLQLKQSQLTYRDDYGEWQFDDWDRELDRFAARFADLDRCISSLSDVLSECVEEEAFDADLAHRLVELVREDAREAITEGAGLSSLPKRESLYSPSEMAQIEQADVDHLRRILHWDAYERPAEEARLANDILKGRAKRDKTPRPGEQPPQERPSKSGRELESHCVSILSSLGWDTRSTAASGDQGADIVATANGVRIVIQCKDYDGRVGNSAVQEVAAARAHYGADFAIVVAPRGYTKSARQLANTNRVHLSSPEGLAQLVNQLA